MNGGVNLFNILQSSSFSLSSFVFIRVLCCHCFFFFVSSFDLYLLRQHHIQWIGQSICASISYTSTNNKKANKIPANLKTLLKTWIYLLQARRDMKWNKIKNKNMTAFYNCQLAKSWEFCYRALLFSPRFSESKLHASMNDMLLFVECGTFQVCSIWSFFLGDRVN